MSDRIINLRQRRKQKARAEKRAEADRNATEHGRSRAERNLTEARNQQEAQKLDGHRLDRDGPADDG